MEHDRDQERAERELTHERAGNLVVLRNRRAEIGVVSKYVFSLAGSLTGFGPSASWKSGLSRSFEARSPWPPLYRPCA